MSGNGITRINIGNLIIKLMQMRFEAIPALNGGVRPLDAYIDSINRSVKLGNSRIKTDLGDFADGLEIRLTLRNQGVGTVNHLVGSSKRGFVCVDGVRG